MRKWPYLSYYVKRTRYGSGTLLFTCPSQRMIGMVQVARAVSQDVLQYVLIVVIEDLGFCWTINGRSMSSEGGRKK
jgi:hypothetical protein